MCGSKCAVGGGEKNAGRFWRWHGRKTLLYVAVLVLSCLSLGGMVFFRAGLIAGTKGVDVVYLAHKKKSIGRSAGLCELTDGDDGEHR